MQSLSVSILSCLLCIGKDLGSLSQWTAPVLISQVNRKRLRRISQTVCSAAQRALPGIMTCAHGITPSLAHPLKVILCQLPTSKHLRVLQQQWEMMWRHSGTLEREASWERHSWGDEGFPGLAASQTVLPSPCHDSSPCQRVEGKAVLASLAKLEKP